MPSVSRPPGVPGSATVSASVVFVPGTLSAEARAALIASLQQGGWPTELAETVLGEPVLWDPSIEGDGPLVDWLATNGYPYEAAVELAASYRAEIMDPVIFKKYQTIFMVSVVMWRWPTGYVPRAQFFVEPPLSEGGADEPPDPGGGAGPGGTANDEVSGTLDSTTSLDGEGGFTTTGGHPYPESEEAADEEDEKYEEQEEAHQDAPEDEPEEDEPSGGGDDIFWENEANLLRTAEYLVEYVSVWPETYAMEAEIVSSARLGWRFVGYL